MNFKKTVKNTLRAGSLGLLFLPVLAMATATLVIHNNTDYPSTSIINGGICSSFLPAGIGITEPHSTNSVPGVTVHSACWANRENCSAVIYLTQDCSGASIGTVVLSTTSGVKSISATGAYSITGNGFEVTLG
ncbi:MAG: hypothetical protein V4501_01235 [Pseudomonadota bacterium]